MTNKTCSLCGMIFQYEGEMCPTCLSLMSGDVQAPVFDPHAAQALSAPPVFEPVANHSFQMAQAESPFQPAPAAAVNGSFQPNQPPAQSFAPAENSAYRYSPPPIQRFEPQPAEPAYKPSFWYWVTELPTFVKVGAVVLIFSICFAAALKTFMAMDVSISSTGAALEPQKPWFSSWFRSKPTVEEIFDKHETVTFAKNKNLKTNGYELSGRAQILKPINGSIDFAKLRKDPESAFKSPEDSAPAAPPASQPKYQPFPKQWDFNIAFELSIKAPNKTLLQMTMKPKEGFTQTFMAYKTVGYDGEKGWYYNKTFMNGNPNVNEEVYKNPYFFLNGTGDGISMATQRSMFAKAELVGEEIVFNRRTYNVRVTDQAGESASLYFDIETGLIARASKKGNDFMILAYDSFEGVMYPSKIVYSVNNDWVLLVVEKLRSDATFDDAIFQRASYK